MKNLMRIHYIAGINMDRVQVIIENQGNKVFSKEYSIGYNASSSKKNEEYARKNHEDSIKYNWKTVYSLKPYIGDILNELKENFQITENEIIFTGYNVFTGNDFNSEDIERYKGMWI